MRRRARRLAVLAAALLLAGAPGCRKIITRHKVASFREAKTAAIEWDMVTGKQGPAIYTDTIERILEEAGLRMVDASKQAPDLLVHIELRGSYTYERPKPNDWWDSGEVSLLRPDGSIYFKHFYGDDVDAPTSFYARRKGFYVKFLAMVSRIWGREVAESEVRHLGSDPDFGDVPRLVVERLSHERRRD